MKLALLVILLIGSSLCALSKTIYNRIDKNDKSLETTSNETSSSVESATYALANVKMDKMYEKNPNAFKPATIVQQLIKEAPLGGEITSPDVKEFNSAEDKFYYNGEKGKTITTVSYCRNLDTNACFADFGCGVCGATKECIPGSRMGPQKICENGYEFAAPQANWNPGLDVNNVSVTHQEIGGAVLTTFKSTK
jgi:hypothetical protein